MVEKQSEVTALAVYQPMSTALCVWKPQVPVTHENLVDVPVPESQPTEQREPKKRPRSGNPFRGLRLDEKHPKAEVEFVVTNGITARATFNLSEHPGRLSRGTIALIDPETGYLLQKDARDTKHNFKNSIHGDLIVPVPARNQTPAQAMEAAARKAANKLVNKYRSRIYGSLREQGVLAKLSLGQALELYGADYIADRSTSAELRKTYRNQLDNLANYLGERPIKDLKRIDLRRFVELHKGANGTEYIEELNRFLEKTAYRLGVEMPAKDVLESFLRGARRGDVEAEAQRQQRKAANSDVLPAEYERKLDEGCWAHFGDPMWAATVMLKEGGLSVKAVCELRIKDVVRTGDRDEVYIAYRRDDLAAYTHNYTFPLTPFGGRYTSQWMDRLAKLCPAERVEGEKYLFALDDLGVKPLESSELTNFVRVELGRYVFGYSGRVQLDGQMISPGVKMLYATREKHLREDCRFDGDRGAISFLLHQALTGQVQADHYRCFTDETGRRFLYRHLSQTRHGLPPSETKHTRVSARQCGDVRELRFPPKTEDVGIDEIITLTIEGLQVGDVIEVRSAEGCYFENVVVA